MTDRFDPKKSAEILSAPPTLRYRSNEGEWVEESQVLVGWIQAPEARRRHITDHGIDLRYASFNPDTLRWECCLFSEEVADMLIELIQEGDFPFARPAVCFHHRNNGLTLITAAVPVDMWITSL